MKKRYAIYAGVIATATLGAACGTSILGTDPDTGLAVLVTRGPIQPVAMEGEVNDAPVPGATVRVRASAGGGATQAITAGHGTVTIQILPGRYRVDVTDCPGALTLPGEMAVDVEAGSLAPVTLSCDTGIR